VREEKAATSWALFIVDTVQVVDFKWSMGSFSNIKSEADPRLATVGYCMTDNPCMHWEVRLWCMRTHSRV
jgi:hypothetical protein